MYRSHQHAIAEEKNSNSYQAQEEMLGSSSNQKH
jgi:hypothetical protein